MKLSDNQKKRNPVTIIPKLAHLSDYRARKMLKNDGYRLLTDPEGRIAMAIRICR